MALRFSWRPTRAPRQVRALLGEPLLQGRAYGHGKQLEVLDELLAVDLSGGEIAQGGGFHHLLDAQLGQWSVGFLEPGIVDQCTLELLPVGPPEPAGLGLGASVLGPQQPGGCGSRSLSLQQGVGLVPPGFSHPLLFQGLLQGESCGLDLLHGLVTLLRSFEPRQDGAGHLLGAGVAILDLPLHGALADLDEAFGQSGREFLQGA